MRTLSLAEVLVLHRLIVESSGGSLGIRDLGALKSALAQPRMTFHNVDLYATLAEKVAAMGYSLVMNHPFIDGNKRVAHAAMETVLVLNGAQLSASIEDQEQLMLGLAAGTVTREALVAWIGEHLVET